MGLISRVSSRTYRSTYFTSFQKKKLDKKSPKMMQLTRQLAHLTPKQFKNGTGIHDGLRPRIQPKRDISALIQVSRWTLLLLGIWYGNDEWHRVAAIRGAEKKAEIAALNKMLDAEAAVKAKANEEFIKTSILYGNPESP